MQNRYAGDVGDFGKLGMLRCIEKHGITIGVNWYLVEDESHNNDGKHVGYLKDKKYASCDNELLTLLGEMVQSQNRSVLEIEGLKTLSSQVYYHEKIEQPGSENDISREKWHNNGLAQMQGCELVFLDPDNGLIPKSVGRGSNKSPKYVFPEEIIDYYRNGYSVVFYNHRTREKLDKYLERFSNLFNSEELKGSTIKATTFRRGTLRDYFFILQKEHVERVETALEEMMKSKWREHFSLIDIND